MDTPFAPLSRVSQSVVIGIAAISAFSCFLAVVLAMEACAEAFSGVTS